MSCIHDPDILGSGELLNVIHNSRRSNTFQGILTMTWFKSNNPRRANGCAGVKRERVSTDAESHTHTRAEVMAKVSLEDGLRSFAKRARLHVSTGSMVYIWWVTITTEGATWCGHGCDQQASN